MFENNEKSYKKERKDSIGKVVHLGILGRYSKCSNSGTVYVIEQ